MGTTEFKSVYQTLEEGINNADVKQIKSVLENIFLNGRENLLAETILEMVRDNSNDFTKDIALKALKNRWELSVKQAWCVAYQIVNNRELYKEVVNELIENTIEETFELIDEDNVEVVYQIVKIDDKGNNAYVYPPNFPQETEFDNLQDAYNAYSNLELSEEDEIEGFEIHLNKWDKTNNGILDWTSEELESVGESPNGWIIK